MPDRVTTKCIQALAYEGFENLYVTLLCTRLLVMGIGS